MVQNVRLAGSSDVALPAVAAVAVVTTVWDDARVRAALDAAIAVVDATTDPPSVDELTAAIDAAAQEAPWTTVTTSPWSRVVELRRAIADDELGQAARHLAATLDVKLTDRATVADLFTAGSLDDPIERAAQLVYEAHTTVAADAPSWANLDDAGRQPFRDAVRAAVAAR